MAPFPFIYDGIARELFILGLDFRLVIEPGYLTVALPKLDREARVRALRGKAS